MKKQEENKYIYIYSFEKEKTKLYFYLSHATFVSFKVLEETLSLHKKSDLLLLQRRLLVYVYRSRLQHPKLMDKQLIKIMLCPPLYLERALMGKSWSNLNLSPLRGAVLVFYPNRLKCGGYHMGSWNPVLLEI